MANVLSAEKRLEVLAALVNGSSIRATSRMTEVHQDTIGRFGALVGTGCARVHNLLVHDLTCSLVDLDEQHSWCSVRQVMLDPGRHDEATMGEQWTWAAICRTSKLIIAWHVGKRTQASADVLVADVRARLVVMPQITTDGLKLYEAPIAVNFGPAVPYMQTIKNKSKDGKRLTAAERAALPRADFIRKRAVYGAPAPEVATTYAIERNNLTGRQWNARLGRRTLSFSKDLDRHKASVALFYVHYNLCHVPQKMKITPAMAAGVTDHVWELGELLAAALAAPVAERPIAKPLTIPVPEGTSRALPAGRGFLRVVGAGSGANSPSPSPGPGRGPVAPAAPTPTSVPAPAPAPALLVPRMDANGQCNLFAPRRMVQVEMFGAVEPEPPQGGSTPP